MNYATSHMPEKAPLAMREQNFTEAPRHSPKRLSYNLSERLWRIAAFAPAMLVTMMLTYAVSDWFSKGGVTLLEAVIVVLVGLTFVWVSLSASTVLLGLVRHIKHPKPERGTSSKAGPQRVALLMPIYAEKPHEIFGNAMAMLQDLARGPQSDAYTLFFLSDTQCDNAAALEERAFHFLKSHAPLSIEIYYRRRLDNTDKKVGNLTDWIENWGNAYDSMIVLDSDSLMTGSAIRRLTRALAADDRAGLIQSFPSLIGSETLFGRMQQFSNTVYGWLLAEGLVQWSQREGNYWGHNAIIRIRAFADSARLPHLRDWKGQSNLILSHDFVEAGMLLRAGWSVIFLPQASGSYEETPQTLVDHALRDRRWCRGNLQHLRLLAAKGFHPITRFHLLQGALAFLMSPAWFVLIAIWALIEGPQNTSLVYFSESNPLFPIWPEQSANSGIYILLFIYFMLLFPKLMAVLLMSARPKIRAIYGGVGPFLATALFEIACSIIYAPILMVQQTLSVVRAMIGGKPKWSIQARGHHQYGFMESLRFHAVETLLGAILMLGILWGGISLWILPIALSLLLAVPLSQLGSVKLNKSWAMWLRLESPNTLDEPRILASARRERALVKAWLQNNDEMIILDAA